MDIEKLKKAQSELREQIDFLQKKFAEREEFERYTMQDEEIRALLSALAKQNQRLARRLDNLASMVIESSKTPNTTIIKSLIALTRSQIEALEMLTATRERLESFEKVQLSGLREAYQAIEKKVSELAKVISQLPVSRQVEVLSKEVKELSEEVKMLEALVSTEIPDTVKYDIELLKKEIVALKEVEAPQSERLAQLEQRLKALEEKLGALEGAEKQTAPRIDELSKRVGELQKIVAGVTELVQKLPPEQVLVHIEGLKRNIDTLRQTVESAPKQKEVEELRQRIEALSQSLAQLSEKVAAEISEDEAERKMLSQLAKSIAELGADVDKLERWIEAYPIGDAERVAFLKKQFGQIEQAIRALEKAEVQRQMAEALTALSKRIEMLEKRMAEERQKAEVGAVLARLEAIEEWIKKARSQQIEKQMAEIRRMSEDLKKQIVQLGGEQKGPELGSQIKVLFERIEHLEKEIKKQRAVHTTALEQLGAQLSQLRQKIERSGIAPKVQLTVPKVVGVETKPSEAIKPVAQIAGAEKIVQKAKEAEEHMARYEVEVEKARQKVERAVQEIDRIKIEKVVNFVKSKGAVSIEEVSLATGIAEDEIEQIANQRAEIAVEEPSGVQPSYKAILKWIAK